MVAISPPLLLALIALADDAERTRVAQWLAARGYEVASCRTVADVRDRVDELQRVDTVITDARLPDGDAHEVLVLAGMLKPFPYCAVVASATTSSGEAFTLAQAGTRVLLERPLDNEMLERALPRESLRPPPLDPIVRAYVGQVDLAELQRLVRAAALRQALALSAGSRSGAARLLKVTRQAVQHMLRTEDEVDDADDESLPPRP